MFDSARASSSDLRRIAILVRSLDMPLATSVRLLFRYPWQLAVSNSLITIENGCRFLGGRTHGRAWGTAPSKEMGE